MIKYKRLFKSFGYAFKGLKKVLREEQNLQIQLGVASIVLFLAAVWDVNRMEWIILVLVIGLVMLMEIANSAVERITDVLKPRLDHYVKEIKDITAAAVFLASLVAVIIGIMVFWPYLFA